MSNYYCYAHGSMPSPYRIQPHRQRETLSALLNGKKAPTHSATQYDEKHEAPWQHMARAYTWVIEHEVVRHEKRDRKTEQWILEQQIYFEAERDINKSKTAHQKRRHSWEELAHVYEVEAEQWMKQEEEMRRVMEAKQWKAWMLQEELNRIQARIRRTRETERKKLAGERMREHQQAREQEKMAMLAAWRSYEERWGILAGASKVLSFSNIPWPLLRAPSKADEVDPAAISSFLLSPFHSGEQTKRERIRNAQLRWHPDKFKRVIDKVREEDKAEVEAAAAVVARCLNAMMRG